MNLTKSTTAQVVETSVIVNNRYYDHPDDHSQPTFEKLLRLDFEMTPGFKPSLHFQSLF